MKKNNEYQAIYNLYMEKRDKNVEMLLKSYEKNKDLKTIMHATLKQILASITTANICLDTIMTVFYLISDYKNIPQFDKKVSKKLLKNFGAMSKYGNAILKELYMVTEILQLPKFHSH